MKVLSLKKHAHDVDTFINYIQHAWLHIAAELYEDCIKHSLDTSNPLPQWYLLQHPTEYIIGCAGLITNDFISRMDLYPWL